MKLIAQGKEMTSIHLHEDKCLRVLRDEKSRIIDRDRTEGNSAMNDEEFRRERTGFASDVEARKAAGILVDLSRFRHKTSPDTQQWRVKNISSRYNDAGVQRFAFLLPKDAPIPPLMNQSSRGEGFLTRAFNDAEQATSWLTATD